MLLNIHYCNNSDFLEYMLCVNTAYKNTLNPEHDVYADLYTGLFPEPTQPI